MSFIGKREKVGTGLFVEPLYGWKGSDNKPNYVCLKSTHHELVVGYFFDIGTNPVAHQTPPDAIVMAFIPPCSSPAEIQQIIEDVKKSSSYAEVLKSHAQGQIKRQGEDCSQSYSKVQKMEQAETPSLLCQMTRDESTTMSQAKRSKPE
jgi:hypothetical protein